MKTITTVLPVHDRIEKQAYERAKGSLKDQIIAILTPRFKLPSMQWLVEADDPGAVTSVILCTKDSEFNYPTKMRGWTNTSWDTFTTDGLDITSAIHAAGGALAGSNPTYIWNAAAGEKIKITGLLTINSGNAPQIILYEAGAPTAYNLTAGENTIEYTCTAGGTIQLSFYNHTFGAANCSFTNVEIYIDQITQLFTTLPELLTSATLGDFFQYNGDTLKWLLPTGFYYLKIQTANGYVYYSDYFEVRCIFDNLISSFTNSGYETLTTSGTQIISAINSAGDAYTKSDSFTVKKGENIRVIFNYTKNSGTSPVLYLVNTGWTLDDSSVIASGINDIMFTATWTGYAYLIFYNGATNVNFETTEILVLREFSDKYIIINFSNTCDLGDTVYDESLEQIAYLETEPMEMSFPTILEGQNNGEGKFVATFGRQVKKYTARLFPLPDYMVELFNRMRLHNTVELINLVGDVNDIYNLEVDHEWISPGKYYAKIDLTFDYDESVLITACCPV